MANNKLEELQELWKKDSQFDETELGRESLNTPSIFCKWLNIHSTLKLQLYKSISDYKKLYKNKLAFFRGELTQEELETLGWDYSGLIKRLKSESHEYVLRDDDIIREQNKIDYLQTLVEYAESVMKMINNRGFQIKNAIDWQRFVNGSSL